jgi:hypothetical protein
LDLDHVQFVRRQQAFNELARTGKRAEPVLREALAAGPSAEKRMRLDALLTRLASPTPSPDYFRLTRAVQVLEYIGDPNARETLKLLAAGEHTAPLTRDAKAAANRLDER